MILYYIISNYVISYYITLDYTLLYHILLYYNILYIILYYVVLYYFISYHNLLLNIIEGSLKAKFPTIWTDEKQSREEAERRGRLEERRVEEKE